MKKKVKYYWIVLYILSIAAAWYFAIFWLFLSVLIAVSFDILFILLQPNIVDIRKKTIYLLGIKILTVLLFLFLFVFKIYKVPTDSMANIILPGDVIVVDKSNKLQTAIQNAIFPNQSVHLQRRGDIVTFINTDKNTFVKRCVGIPGDVLAIVNAEPYVNGKRFSPASVRKSYLLSVSNTRLFYKQIDSIGFGDAYFTEYGQNNILETKLTKYELQKIGCCSQIRRIDLNVKTVNQSSLFYKDPEGICSIDNMGPFTVPQKGQRLIINEQNFLIYKNILNNFENVAINKKGSNYFIGSQKISEYIFKNNYYFFLGDNREVSKDSRYYGFIPEYNIIGKTNYIAFSVFEGGINYDRCLKYID